jgi:hypothetical protein
MLNDARVLEDMISCAVNFLGKYILFTSKASKFAKLGECS